VAKVCFQTAPPVLAGVSDEERLRAVNAQVSPAIGIVTESHRSDRIAAVDYKVTNIRRDEPPATLFDVTDYTFVDGSHDDPLVGFSPWQSHLLVIHGPLIETPGSYSRSRTWGVRCVGL
jgi:hypothetical protein